MVLYWQWFFFFLNNANTLHLPCWCRLSIRYKRVKEKINYSRDKSVINKSSINHKPKSEPNPLKIRKPLSKIRNSQAQTKHSEIPSHTLPSIVPFVGTVKHQRIKIKTNHHTTITDRKTTSVRHMKAAKLSENMGIEAALRKFNAHTRMEHRKLANIVNHQTWWCNPKSSASHQTKFSLKAKVELPLSHRSKTSYLQKNHKNQRK